MSILSGMADDPAPIINDEADRALGRIIIRHGLATLALLLIMTVVMAVVNAVVPGPLHRFLNTLGLLVVLVPFFVGTNRLFAARLALGREFVQQRRWREAIAALDPFAGAGQRFLDSSGEAHYLLALAYAGAGDRERAAAARAFVQRYRPGRWAQALPQAANARQEKRARPANIKGSGKPRRHP